MGGGSGRVGRQPAGVCSAGLGRGGGGCPLLQKANSQDGPSAHLAALVGGGPKKKFGARARRGAHKGAGTLAVASEARPLAGSRLGRCSGCPPDQRATQSGLWPDQRQKLSGGHCHHDLQTVLTLEFTANTLPVIRIPRITPPVFSSNIHTCFSEFRCPPSAPKANTTVSWPKHPIECKATSHQPTETTSQAWKKAHKQRGNASLQEAKVAPSKNIRVSEQSKIKVEKKSKEPPPYPMPKLQVQIPDQPQTLRGSSHDTQVFPPAQSQTHIPSLDKIHPPRRAKGKTKRK